jgi:hypothetical protein
MQQRLNLVTEVVSIQKEIILDGLSAVSDQLSAHSLV